MKHNYHERKERRIENALRSSAKNEQVSESLFEKARQISNATQGEPVKRGHHSEGRHRRDLETMDNSMRGSVDASDKAQYYADKAESIQSNTSISSDNPDALTLLRDKLQKLLKNQELMKAINKAVRKGDKTAFMLLPGASEKNWEGFYTKDEFGRNGIPKYKLSNNNGRITQARKRLQELDKSSTQTTSEKMVKGVQVVQNAEANRVQLIFPGKPVKEIRIRLKRAGFHWCEEEGAWQRHLNATGIYEADRFLETYQEPTS